MRRFLSDPRVYVAWLVVLIATLFAAHATDPYLFGFAAFGLGAATGVLCLTGGWLVVLNVGATRRSRWTVSVSLLLAGVAVLLALSILGTFRWA